MIANGLDTTILAYAEGANDAERMKTARVVLDGLLLAGADMVLPVQVAGELFRVLRGRMKRGAAEARDIVAAWQDLCRAQATTPRIFRSALELATDHQISIWDAVIMAAAAEAGCRLLLSEDMRHGFLWRGTTVVDPFRRTPIRCSPPP